MLLPFTRTYCCIKIGVPLPNKEPSLSDIICCSIIKTILKGVDIGILSLNEV